MNGLVRDPSSHRAEAAEVAMRGLRVAALTHRDHQERELEAFYVTHADHREVKAMEGEFRTQGPADGGRFSAWILDGITPDARAAIAVPGPVPGLLTGIVGRGYRREVAPAWRWRPRARPIGRRAVGGGGTGLDRLPEWLTRRAWSRPGRGAPRWSPRATTGSTSSTG